MVVAVKIPNQLHKKICHCDVDLPVVSFNSALKCSYALKAGELLVNARCDFSLLEPFSS